MDMRVAAYVVITDDEGRMLLARFNTGSFVKWTLPGGGIDPGEDPADAARREVEEETGYTVELDELIGIHSFVIPGAERIVPEERSVHALRIVYRGHVTGGELRFETHGSTDMAEWFRPAQIAALDRVELVNIARDMAKEDLV